MLYHYTTWTMQSWKYSEIIRKKHADIQGTSSCFTITSSTVKAPVFGTLNSAISNFQTWFVRTVMEVLEYC